MCPTVWFYVAEIYRIQDEHPEATLTMLAEGMDVSLQAASRMIRRMAEEGLVIHEPYKGVTLTEKGRKIALLVLRRHRILEYFLVNVMGFGWDEVHDMTDSLERGMTDKLIARMNEMADFPTRCPHGEPIPNEDGIMPQINDQPLTEWELEKQGRVSRVKSHDPERLRYLKKIQVVPGATITVTGKSPFNGPIHLSTEDDKVVIGNELAGEIYVEKSA